MKRLLVPVLVTAILLSLAACSADPVSTTEVPTEPPVTAPVSTYRVATPMAYPDYSVPENYTTDDLRAIAVRAMGDMLSIQWSPDRYLTYKNPIDLPDKQFQFVQEVTYTGVPYANAHTGIFQWMRYYDTETGILSFPGDGQTWSETLGTVCADCMMWGWSTVANSMGGSFTTYRMVPQNGYLPVNGYTIPSYISSYRDYPTDRIISDNGEAVMLEAYAAMLPADALTSTPEVHAVMVTEAPNVVRKEDGTIDADASTVLIQDQRGGVGNHFYEVEKDGVTHLMSGRIGHSYTFAELLSMSYIPLTAAEFIGEKEYSAAEAAYVGDTDALNKLYAGKITANYPLCNLDIILCRADGTETNLYLKHYTKAATGNDKGADGFTYLLTDLIEAGLESLIAEADAGEGATVKLVVQLSTGDIFELATLSAK